MSGLSVSWVAGSRSERVGETTLSSIAQEQKQTNSVLYFHYPNNNSKHVGPPDSSTYDCISATNLFPLYCHVNIPYLDLVRLFRIRSFNIEDVDRTRFDVLHIILSTAVTLKRVGSLSQYLSPRYLFRRFELKRSEAIGLKMPHLIK